LKISLAKLITTSGPNEAARIRFFMPYLTKTYPFNKLKAFYSEYHLDLQLDLLAL